MNPGMNAASYDSGTGSYFSGTAGSTDSGSGSDSSTLSALLYGIQEIAAGDDSGDIVIPVYLGGTMLDEVIINAQQRANLRSGGR